MPLLGQSWILDDFKTLSIYGKSRKKASRGVQNKGHAKEVEQFLSAIRDGNPTPIPTNEIFEVTEVTNGLASGGCWKR